MEDAREKYSDIIDREYHGPQWHKPMPKASRAAQFSPFAALTGYDDLVGEAARLTDAQTDVSEDGRQVSCPFKSDLDTAENRERQEAMIREQLSKRSGHYLFSVENLEIQTPGGSLPLLSASLLNSIRRLVASDLDALPCGRLPMAAGRKDTSVKVGNTALSYKYNVSNAAAAHRKDAELMRTRYCVRSELGMCPVHQGAKESRPLFLMNNGRRLALHFDCAKCEMTVTEDA